MKRSVDWLPRRQGAVLERALSWCNNLSEEVKLEGETKKRYEWYGIPLAEITELMDAYTEARDTHQIAKNKHTRTVDTISAAKTALEKLKAAMRSLKKKRLFFDLLGPEGFAIFELKVPDPVKNLSGVPTVQLRIKAYLTGGFHELGIRFEFICGDPNDLANKEYRVYYKLVNPGESDVKDVSELTLSFGATKLKITLPLEPGDSGKKIFMAARVENGDKKGPWGPIVSAIVP